VLPRAAFGAVGGHFGAGQLLVALAVALERPGRPVPPLGLQQRRGPLADPVEEVFVAYEILKTLELRQHGPTMIACPTCGRVEVDLFTIANQIDISPALLVLSLLPHALPELVALFLPLAAWLVASRRDRWDELLAATVVTVGVAVPVLLVSGAIELWVSPQLLQAISGVA